MRRAYDAVAARLAPAGDRRQRMQAVVDELWPALAQSGVSWVGFYTHAGAEELVLGPRRDRPACSPIGMHGVCGRAFRERRPLVVRDVAALGANYIACDPRDRAEVVIPLLEQDGSCWGVLDLDSFSPGAFSLADVEGLLRVLRAAGLTSGAAGSEAAIVV